MLFVGLGAGTALGALAVSAVLLLQAPVLVPMPIVIPAPPVVIPEPPLPPDLPRLPPIPPDAEAGYGRFACATKPLGAEVWIDGENTGEKTPISVSKAIPLKAGRHWVVFRREGKRSGPHEIEVREGELAKLVGIIIE